MRFPNKLFDYKESVLADCIIIIMNYKLEEISILDLYALCKKNTSGIQGFYDALDVLYTLGKIKYNEETRRISSVK